MQIWVKKDHGEGAFTNEDKQQSWQLFYIVQSYKTGKYFNMTVSSADDFQRFLQYFSYTSILLSLFFDKPDLEHLYDHFF